MRSTMRQLLGGKKSHKLTEEPNRSSGLDLPNKTHGTTGMRNDSMTDGATANGSRIGVGYEKNSHNYDRAISPGGNAIANSYDSGFPHNMPMTGANNMSSGMGNAHGNYYPNNTSLSKNLGNGIGNNNFYAMNNMHNDVDLFSDPVRGPLANNPYANSSDSTAMRFDGGYGAFSSNRLMDSPSSNPMSLPQGGNISRTEHRNVAERSRYVNMAPTSPPAIIAGAVSDTNEPCYLRCEDEPIHTPGAVQSLGALIGLKYNEVGDLEVRIASENSRKVIGYGPEQLFALGSFLEILKEEVRHDVAVYVDHCLKVAQNKDLSQVQTQTITQTFQLTLSFPYEPDCRLWCTMHASSNIEGLLICEFEDYTEDFYLKDSDAAKALPNTPIKGTDFETTPEEMQKSTVKSSEPLSALTVMHQKDCKTLTYLDMFSCLSQAQAQIAPCQDTEQIGEVVVGLISELTGFHRVMFYRFDKQKNGCVEAELVNPRASTDIFRGLHYPESDIPPQARELYIINRMRILYDRSAETSRLVCRDDADFKEPLDLSHSYLRAMSPIHIKYLQNMGVKSTFTISIVIDNDLWGLIACHGYGEHGIRVSLPMRDLCRSISECAALNIQRLLSMKRVMARKIPASLPSKNSTPPGDLLSLVDADFAVISLDNKVRAIGRMEPFDEASAVISYLQSCRIDRTSSSHCIRADFPKLIQTHRIKVLCGVLIVPLSVGKENDFLVFFRKGKLRHVNWAGNPNEKIFKASDQYLEPRQSFQRFVQTINNASREWTEDQLDTASILALLYGRFAETWRTKTTNSLPAKDREIVKVPPATQVDDTFNLKAAATRVLEALKKEAQRKALDLTVSVHDALPTTVIGDADCFKQVMLYFIRNGFKSSQRLKVDVNLVRVQEDTSHVELRVQDAGPGMSESELDDTFQEFERAQSEEKWPFPTQGNSPNRNDSSRGNVTLSVVATFVRSINGQIQVTSELGKGTIFTVELPYKCALGTDGSISRQASHLAQSNNGSQISPALMPPSATDKKTRSDTSTPSGQAPLYSPTRARPLEDTPRRSGVDSNGFNSNHGEVDDSATLVKNNHSHAVGFYEPGNSQLQDRGAPGSISEPRQTNVLIADSDLVSLRLIEENLLQYGYAVKIAHDGQECHDCFALNPAKVDVILVELKMPFVDGVLSTRMIRIAEKEAKHRAPSEYTQYNKPRVPIIAISYVLDEDSRFDYIQSGFDGWILKPIDYQRLGLMLQGLNNPQLRQEALYVPGQLKKGGWFLP